MLIGATNVLVPVGLWESSIPDLRFCGTSCGGGLVVYGLQQAHPAAVPLVWLAQLQERTPT
jgi:acetyl esterase/lipase